MGQALYRKYRSRSLAEIVGQSHITDTLGKALAAGRISHAYLFTGPRGVGKTSIARILAHELNGLPYDDEQSHLDIIEIDAASNNGVEDVRDLRDKVYVAPTSGKYKVYIIDEVHMLSKAAFNALLKTLEEPPAHVVFILATTEAHKLPETIISRTQRYLFRPIEPTVAVEHLKYIAKTEQIAITDEALELLALHGDGSFRDSISLLDQASGLGKLIELGDIQSLLGIPPTTAITSLAELLASGGAGAADTLSQLHQLYEQGFQATAIAKGLSGALRELLIGGKVAGDAQRVTALLAKLLEVASSHDPERFLEICLLEASTIATVAPTMPALAPPAITSPSAPAAKLAPKAAAKAKKPTPAPKEEETATTPNEPSTVASTGETASDPSTAPLNGPVPSAVVDTAIKTSDLGLDLWNSVLGELKKQYNTLYSVARMAKPDFSQAGKLELTCGFAFHQKRLHEAKNRQIIGDIIQRLSGQALEVIALHDPEVKLADKTTPPSVAASPAGEPLSAISNIFGGGELLNS